LGSCAIRLLAILDRIPAKIARPVILEAGPDRVNRLTVPLCLEVPLVLMMPGQPTWLPPPGQRKGWGLIVKANHFRNVTAANTRFTRWRKFAAVD
jgi:hypothetical protein